MYSKNVTVTGLELSTTDSIAQKDRQSGSGSLSTKYQRSNTAIGSAKSEGKRMRNPAVNRVITIWTKKSTIEIPSDLPEYVISKILKAVFHAL